MSQITVYQTDEDGAFLHTAVAHELALSPGTYNIPFGAKLNPPPDDVPEGKVAVAVLEGWSTLEDHRKDTLYLVDTGEPYPLKTTLAINGIAVRYNGLGTIPDWLTDQALVPVIQEESNEEGENNNPPENE